MLGFTVLRVTHQSGDRLIEEWQAPALSCFALGSSLSRFNNGVAATLVTRTAMAVKVGAPDPKYFQKHF